MRDGSLRRLAASQATISPAQIDDCLSTLPELEGATSADVVAVDADANDIIYVSISDADAVITASVDSTSCELIEISSN